MTTFYIFKVNRQTDELFQKVYQKQVTWFNRGYISAVPQLQHTCKWTLSTVEKASGTIIKVQGHITNFYQRYNLMRNFATRSHPLNNLDPLKRIDAGLTMALHHYSYAAVQSIAEPLRTRVIQ